MTTNKRARTTFSVQEYSNYCNQCNHYDIVQIVKVEETTRTPIARIWSGEIPACCGAEFLEIQSPESISPYIRSRSFLRALLSAYNATVVNRAEREPSGAYFAKYPNNSVARALLKAKNDSYVLKSEHRFPIVWEVDEITENSDNEWLTIFVPSGYTYDDDRYDDDYYDDRDY